MCESVNLARFMPVYVVVSGTGIPAGMKSPPGIGDGEGRLPVVVHGDGAGENSPPRGRGWWLILRRGIPHCHLYTCKCIGEHRGIEKRIVFSKKH